VCPSLSLASRSDISVRDQYILSYADYLHSDPALWRITVAYMCSCGGIGRERADQILLRVPISFKTSSGDSGGVNAAARSGEVPAALKAVVEACHEYGRESVRRMVCTVVVPPATSITCLFFLKLSCVDCGTKFPSTPAIWTGYLICNLGRKLDLARSNSGRDPGAVY
jgi:hypothetical protein